MVPDIFANTAEAFCVGLDVGGAHNRLFYLTYFQKGSEIP